MTNLPVWATVKGAYWAIWVHRWLLLRFAAVPFVLLLVLGYGQIYAVMHLDEFRNADGDLQFSLRTGLAFHLCLRPHGLL